MPSEKKIVLVDDSAELLELYELILVQHGYEVRTASSVDEAMAVIRTFRPALVITDIVMPERSGLDLITSVRSDLAPPVPLIVALSGFRDVREEALRRGAVLFRLKPLEVPELLRLVATAFRGELAETASAPQIGIARQRQTTAEAAQAAAAWTFVRHPEFATRLRRATSWISTYSGYGVAAVLLFAEGHLRVLCSSHPERLAEGVTADQFVNRAVDVIASGSSLVVPDLGLAKVFALQSDPDAATQPFASVPLTTTEGDVIGNIALFGNGKIPFDAIDLHILQYIAKKTAVVFSEPELRPLAWAPFILREPHWRFLLQQELSHVHAGQSIGVAMIDTTDEFSASSAERLGPTMLPRMSLARISERRFGVFHVAPHVDASRDAILSTLRVLAEVAGVRNAAIATFACSVPPGDAGTLVDIVDAGLQAAALRRSGTVIETTLSQRVTTTSELGQAARA